MCPLLRGEGALMFRSTLGCFLAGMAMILATLASAKLQAASPAEYWLLETDRGEILIYLDRERAPRTTAAILEYIRDEHYQGLIFHRVIEGFVAQAGGYDEALEERSVEGGVVNESGNGLSNRRGSVGLARGANPHSGGAQFYFNLADNRQLNPRPDRWGYAVFGHVVAGMDVVDAIAEIPTEAAGPFESDVPEETVRIRDSRALNREQAREWVESKEAEAE